MISFQFQKKFSNTFLKMAYKGPLKGITTIVGPSGGGKTSLIHMIAGLLPPDNGWLSLDNNILYHKTQNHKIQNKFIPPQERHLGYVFQNSRLFPHMTVKKNLLYGKPVSKTHALSFDDIIDLLELKDLLLRFPQTLSGGEQQRVAIGRALLSHPQLLLMDEPLTALDVQKRQRILPMIEHLRDTAQIPIFYVTHSLDDVLRLSNQILLIEKGEITANGPLNTLNAQKQWIQFAGPKGLGTLYQTDTLSPYATGLSCVPFGKAQLIIPTPKQKGPFRLYIRAQDVALTTKRPNETQSSILNVFETSIKQMWPLEKGIYQIQLSTGNQDLWALVTAHSVMKMKLGSHVTSVFALIKSVGVQDSKLALSPLT